MQHALIPLIGIVASAGAAGAQPPAAQRIAFPDDPAVINIRDFGAVGDGKADDTAAIQHAIRSINDSPWSRVIYFPDGVYRVTAPIRFDHHGDDPQAWMRRGPWLYGQSRDGVILRVPDDTPRFADPDHPVEVIRAHPQEDGARTSADWFDRTMVNFTIDTGNNRGAIGLKFYSNNTGLLRDVRIVGRGTLGLDLGFIDQNGPMLAQRIVIEGFRTGVRTAHAINSQTLCDVTVRGWTEHALLNGSQVVTVESLQTELRSGAIVNGRGGVLTLVNDAAPTTQDAERLSAAIAPEHIDNQGTLYVRVTGAATGGAAREWWSGQALSLYETIEPGSLGLPIRRPPPFAWDQPENWVCANDFGMVPGDGRDDAAAFQRAIDAAAEAGKSTVYIRGSSRPDPNWYNLNGEVRVHGSVRHVLGIGFPRLIGERIVIADDAAPVVKIENLKVFSGTANLIYEHRAADSTLILESCHGELRCTGGGDAFVENVAGSVRLLHPDVRVWARQLNPEGTRQDDRVNCLNDGGRLWILGLKTEQVGTKIRTVRGGATEVYGAHLYTNRRVTDDMPYFEIVDAQASFAGIRETFYHDQPYRFMVAESRGGVVRKLDRPKHWSIFTGTSGE